MALLYHEIYVPMEDVPLSVVSIPSIYQGKYLKIYCDDPIQRDVYLLTNGTLTGPYHSGQKANNGITFTSQFLGNECMMLTVNKSMLTVSMPVAMNTITAVLPSGLAVDICLDCQASAVFHVSDSEELINAYRDSRFTDAAAVLRGCLVEYIKETLSQLLTKLAFSNPMPLVLSCLQNIAGSLCGAARMNLNGQIPGIEIDRVRIDLQCTNVPQIMAEINKPKPTLPPEMGSPIQTVLSNPALTFDQQLKLIDRLCERTYKYDQERLSRAAQNPLYLNPPV